jgi:ribosome biogenesis GTPase
LIDLKQYGYHELDPIPDGLIPGRVTEQRREQYNVVTERGEVTATLKGTFYHGAEAREDFPCVGDFVLLQHNESGVSRIATLLPRRTKFSRADFSGHARSFVKTILEQMVAANFEYVFILSSLNLDFNVKRILRYITQAMQSGGQPVVILTKADLSPDFEAQIAEMREAAPEVPVHAVSAHSGLGLTALEEYLQPGKTVVFLGMSGVGKSSLLNAFMDSEVMAVKAIREIDSRGRHTTTHRQLFMLPSGAMVIDTPGMR